MNLSSKSVELLKKHGFNNALQLFQESENNTSDVIKTDKNGNGFILEAKKVILEEQCDKLSNMQIGEISADEIVEQRHNKDDTIFTELPKKFINFSDTRQLLKKTAILNSTNILNEEKILTKYFRKWKYFVLNNCRGLENNLLVERKLNSLVQTINDKMEKNENTKSAPIKKLIVHTETRTKSSPTIYINRFNAQKNIIQQQKEKLDEQQRLIEQLKFNKIKQDIEKSVEQSKYDIQHIFKNCSGKLKCKLGKVIENSSETSADNSDENVKFDLKSAKVPQMVKEMEKRAMERELNRQVIRERKRIIDEKRKRMAEELVEKKRLLDEDETKRNLEMMKEKRQQEIEKERKRKRNKEHFLNMCKIADNFDERRIVRIYFDCWLRLITMREFNETKAECHYERKLKIKAFKTLLEYSKKIINDKTKQADNLYNFKLKKNSMFKFQHLLRQKRRHFQVAQDFYDMKLEQKIFIQWHRNVCKMQMIELKLVKKADSHYLKKIMFHYFYQWRSLSAVLLLEKAKEEKRMKWRRKVLEVIPDYRPPIDD